MANHLKIKSLSEFNLGFSLVLRNKAGCSHRVMSFASCLLRFILFSCFVAYCRPVYIRLQQFRLGRRYITQGTEYICTLATHIFHSLHKAVHGSSSSSHLIASGFHLVNQTMIRPSNHQTMICPSVLALFSLITKLVTYRPAPVPTGL